jgi:hypothetical protein
MRLKPFIFPPLIEYRAELNPWVMSCGWTSGAGRSLTVVPSNSFPSVVPSAPG